MNTNEKQAGRSIFLSVAILALCAACGSLARAGGIGEVPDMDEGLGAPDMGMSQAMTQSDIQGLDAGQTANLSAVVETQLDLFGPETKPLAAAVDLQQGSMRLHTVANATDVQNAAAKPDVSQLGTAAMGMQVRRVAGDVLESKPGSNDVKINNAGFDGPAFSASANGEAGNAASDPVDVSGAPLQEQVNWAQGILENVRGQWDRVVIGQKDSKDAIMMALIAHGHVFLQSAPGLGKTSLARAVADSISAQFKRIQGTPDLLPSDITGGPVLKKNDKGESELVLKKGPIFTDILLFDEGNRAPPKTQSGVLEAMEERQTTIQGETHKLPMYFTVLETENPLEEQGVFPTPYAALDRYLFMVPVSRPSEQDLVQIMRLNRDSKAKPKAEKVTDLETLDRIRQVALRLTLTPEMESYIARIIETANQRPELKKGHVVSPRAAIGIEIASRIHAVMRGRTEVYPEDVEAVAPLVLRHRLVLDFSAESEGASSEKIVQKILADVKIGETKAAKTK